MEATRFMAGKFPLMIFGLPGAALAMYQAALPEKKKEVSGLLLSAALTSMLTGITEPLEFTFLFTAPLLYGIHCVFAGLAYMLMHMLDVGVGMTFSGVWNPSRKQKDRVALDRCGRSLLFSHVLCGVAGSDPET